MARPPLILGRFAYFDASALAKLAIRNEPDSELAIALWERTPSVYTSWLSYPEARSAWAPKTCLTPITVAGRVAARGFGTRHGEIPAASAGMTE